MVKKGWTKVEVPEAWLQVLRHDQRNGHRSQDELHGRRHQRSRISRPSRSRTSLVPITTQRQPLGQLASKMLGLRAFADPVAKVSVAKERVVKLERALSLGRDRGCPGRHHPHSSRTCQEVITSSSCRVADERLRALSGQSSSALGGNRHPASHGRGQHRGRGKEIVESLKVLWQTQPPSVADTP